MSTYENILRITDTLIQQRGFLGFSYADLEKEIGIRKASIHHHFPRKTDLGIAYCQYKTEVFDRLNITLHNVSSGVQRLRTYLDAFAGCAERGEMCGIYAMLSDSHQFSPELQEAVSQLAHQEIQMIKDIITSDKTYLANSASAAMTLSRISLISASENSNLGKSFSIIWRQIASNSGPFSLPSS